MAGKYFDASGAAEDLQLLPSGLRREQDLADVAEQVLADIVARYTISTYEAPVNAWSEQGSWGWVLEGDSEMAGLVKLADYLYVRLRGYAPDADLADPYLKAAMRREIGHVLRWRLNQQKRDPAVTQASDGDTSRSFREDAGEPFPPTFPMHLRPFVLAEGSWSL